jgi:hypothetical protein
MMLELDGDDRDLLILILDQWVVREGTHDLVDDIEERLVVGGELVRRAWALLERLRRLKREPR